MNNLIEISTVELFQKCEKILESHNVNRGFIKLVLDKLFDCQKEGYYSHGLLKFIDYVNYIEQGLIKVNAQASKNKISKFSMEVDGNMSFGAVTLPTIDEAFRELLEENDIALVSLINANHMGRLAHIVQPIVEEGNIVIGCLNYRGAGRNVVPFGGLEGRHSTNPFVFAAPRRNESMFIHDFTTSKASESEIKLKSLINETLKDDLLIKRDGTTSNNPSDLFANPELAFLTNLGGSVYGYKGWGMTVFADLMSIFIGTNDFPRPDANTFGNSGFFFAFNPFKIFNLNKDEVYSKIEEYIKYIKSVTLLNEANPIIIPGERSVANYSFSSNKDSILIHNEVLIKINDLVQ